MWSRCYVRSWCNDRLRPFPTFNLLIWVPVIGVVDVFKPVIETSKSGQEELEIKYMYMVITRTCFSMQGVLQTQSLMHHQVNRMEIPRRHHISFVSPLSSTKYMHTAITSDWVGPGRRKTCFWCVYNIPTFEHANLACYQVPPDPAIQSKAILYIQGMRALQTDHRSAQARCIVWIEIDIKP